MPNKDKNTEIPQCVQPAVSGSTFSIQEIHTLHSALITAKPHLNERTEGYKTSLELIKKLSFIIGEYYR